MDDKRLIDANELKRRLIEGDGHDDDGFTEGYNFAINEIRGYIADAPTIEAEPDKGWISVKDRLPPTGVPVLIYVYNIEEMTVVSLDHDGLGFSNADEWFNIKNIHHWQHLPEPPKGE